MLLVCDIEQRDAFAAIEYIIYIIGKMLWNNEVYLFLINFHQVSWLLKTRGIIVSDAVSSKNICQYKWAATRHSDFITYMGYK